ncbi:hypothetical protein, partial [Dictyobacter formicarum]|uniref:hypothetical protein n=1 Tax=Dictyobacter formicarum TaxID=2778368 RepID=UPI001F271732
DDGGVMNDNTLRGPQWQQLVGEFFAPRLGGSREAWGEANFRVMDQLIEPRNWLLRLEASSDYPSFYHQYMLDWLEGMCALMNISSPSEEECVELFHKSNAFIIPRVRSAFPGAVGAIQRLHSEGYTLHTASGEPSNELSYYLEGMGYGTALAGSTVQTWSIPSNP